AYRRLADTSIENSELARIPKGDRSDFVRSYGEGRREEALQILNRRSFRESMFLGESRVIRHGDASKGKEADGNTIAEKASVQTAQQEVPKPVSSAVTMRELNLASVNLTGLKIDGESAQRAAKEIPRAGDSRIPTR
ncbi:MAG: hypothetical protein ACKV2U_19085, partial [Bryobacteraceae bacterium]